MVLHRQLKTNHSEQGFCGEPIQFFAGFNVIIKPLLQKRHVVLRDRFTVETNDIADVCNMTD